MNPLLNHVCWDFLNRIVVEEHSPPFRGKDVGKTANGRDLVPANLAAICCYALGSDDAVL